MQTEPFYVDVIGFGNVVDVMPYVREAMAQCQRRHDFTPLEIAALIEPLARGKRLSSDLLGRIEDEALWELTNVVIGWIRSDYRIAQISDPEMQYMRPYIELHYFEDTSICDAAKAMCGRWIKVSELVRFPLPGCWNERCSCSYLTRSRREGPRDHPDWEPL